MPCIHSSSGCASCRGNGRRSSRCSRHAGRASSGARGDPTSSTTSYEASSSPRRSGKPAMRDDRYYRRDIDGLRAVAIIAVLLSHMGLLAGGLVGVDVFFVISGFLISGIILRALAQGTFSIAHFYARRVKRIFPALI